MYMAAYIFYLSRFQVKTGILNTNSHEILNASEDLGLCWQELAGLPGGANVEEPAC